MPTPAYFAKYPPFPSQVPTAKLPVVSFARLLSNDEDESSALFTAARTSGFFLVDLSHSSFGDAFLESAEAMFDLTEEVNALPQEELMQYAYKSAGNIFGFVFSILHYFPPLPARSDFSSYKQRGNLKVESGLPDRVELYNISRDDINGISGPLSNPACIEHARPQIKKYIEQANELVELICAHLEKHLGLEKGVLMGLQPISTPSGTNLRLLRYEPQVRLVFL